ncbi:restriction endonuclease subunit S [Klebsiella quasipneumoniae]|uniref:restriction endonuclease subunit S n=1 Tax=Klebsiella quasipneumoniae TaxID=1463165 RepID=UPI00191CCE5F|nr:restriction endonuclease subunit S [Klebsiella quasipneumoniae]
MGNKWPEFRLDEITTLIIDCPHSTPEWTDSGVIVLRSNNIRNGALDLANPSFTTEEGYLDRIKRAIPAEDDIVLTREAPMGEVCIIPKGLKCCLGQRMVLIRADKTQVIPEYLLYAIQSSYIQNQISWNEGTGTTVSNIRIPNIKALKIPLPSLNIQRGIVSNLLSIDKKISLNIATNQTLEQMSQTLFKSWFMDFDPVIDNALDAGNSIPEALQSRAELRQKVRNSANFKPLPADIRALFPAEFEETELGWVPKGWQPQSMHDLVESVSITYPLSKTDKVIFLNTGDIEKGSFLHQNYSKTEGLPGQAKKSIKKGDILFSEIRPENKRYAFVHFEADDYVVSTKLMVLRAKNKINPLLPYFIITIEDNTKKLQRVAELRSGTFPQITFKELEYIGLIMPNNDKIMELFINSYLTPAYNKIIATKKTNMNFINLRDTLLPKLISGELSLEDLPDLVTQTEPA